MIPETKTMSVKEGNLWRINDLIKTLDLDKNLISDGYHTFGELYEHRITLFIALCRMMQGTPEEYIIWKSIKHSDGSSYPEWFIMGIGTEKGHQITYHLPMSKWDECDFAPELAYSPEWDGHTSNDVLERLKSL